MPRNHRITISLSDDALTLVKQAYEKMRPGRTAPIAATVAYVLTALLEQWSAAEEMFTEPESEPVKLPTDVEERLRSITEPDIATSKSGVTIRHDKTTPKDTDGLVPWAYITAGYSTIEPVKSAAADYTNEGEHKAATIRAVLSRIPEDQWESEQTRSILSRALAQLVTPTTKTGS